MLQRIQTVYMLVVLLMSGILPFLFSVYSTASGAVFAHQEMMLLVLFLIYSLLAIMAIVLFKNRKLQFVLNRLNIIFNLTLLGVFVYRLLTLSGEAQVSEKGIGMFLPIISIVFLVMANKAIKKDEDLVKSVDRLR